jgi:putative FmdB family regulatory protein
MTAMPRYGFRCTHCDLEFDVSRRIDDAGTDAQCPAGRCTRHARLHGAGDERQPPGVDARLDAGRVGRLLAPRPQPRPGHRRALPRRVSVDPGPSPPQDAQETGVAPPAPTAARRRADRGGIDRRRRAAGDRSARPGGADTGRGGSHRPGAEEGPPPHHDGSGPRAHVGPAPRRDPGAGTRPVRRPHLPIASGTPH